MAGVSGLLLASRVIGVWAPAVGFFLGFGTTGVSVICAVVGWLGVPGKERLDNRFLAIVLYDLIHRIPPGPEARTRLNLADVIRPPSRVPPVDGDRKLPEPGG